MDELDIRKIILDFVHAETGWGNPLRPQCEFEDLFLDEPEKLEDNRIRITFRYSFDEDGFSQYPKGHHLEGTVVIETTGEIVESDLEETYTGPACVLDPYKPQSDKDNS